MKFLIIDSHAIIHRAYHALPPFKTKNGEVVNAVYGFVSVLLRALKELEPDCVVAAFDLPGPTFRHKKYKEYKGKRPKYADELYQQIDKVKQVVKAFDIPIYEKPGFEADDIIGTISHKICEKQALPKPEIIILTGDLDALQLVNKQVKVWTMRKGLKDVVLYGPKQVYERYGLKPSQMNDFRGLKGDPSDNIPGVSGIGEKGALNLIKEYASLENLYDNLDKITGKTKEKLVNFKQDAFMSKELSQIQTNVDIDFKLKDCEFKLNKNKAGRIFKKFEFSSLLRRLDIKEKSDDIQQAYDQGILSKQLYEMEKQLEPVIKAMETRGIKVDLKALDVLSKKLNKDIDKLTKQIFKISKFEFNLNSPQQVAQALFDKLDISSEKVKKTPTGSLSTNSNELIKIRDKHKIIPFILKYRELFKLQSGFVDKFKSWTGEDSRIHPNFHQLGTETGRMSCSNPNLQNIPIRGNLGKDIRRVFVAESGYVFVSADYSQIELRIAASLANDTKMIRFFKKGEDVHKQTALQVFDDESKRDIAKALNFGMLYGMGPRSFSERTGLSFKESKEYISKYFEQFSDIAEYRENLIEQVKDQGFIETMFNRKRFLPEIDSIDPRIRSQAQRMAINAKVQGTASDIIKIAMNNMKHIIDPDCFLILQIHDELLFEANKDLLKSKTKEIKDIMESAAELAVPLKVDLKTGSNWGDLIEYK